MTLGILIGCLALAAALALWNGRRRSRADDRSGARPPASPNPLREAVLTRAILERGTMTPDDGVVASVMDWAVDNGVATLVSFADGTTSVYYSSGGGIIGAGSHDAVRRAAQLFRDEALHRRDAFTPSTDFPFPPPQHVTFYLVTAAETSSSGPLSVPSVATARSPWSTLWQSAQAVITEIRLASSQGRHDAR